MFTLDLPAANVSTPSLETAELENLLNYLKQVQQIDLTGYKRPTLMRRTLTRMQQVGVEHYREYLDYLEQQPQESTHLLNTVLINVTDFFRDGAVWDYLANHTIPQIIAKKEPNEPIRVWSAGCASGEETYSLAMLLAEALGIKQFQQRVQLYGTDVDLNAVMQARKGYYSAHEVSAIPAALQKKYFEHTADGYLWRADLRRSTLFHCRSLIQAAPFPRIDLLLCRNTLIYFMEEAQIRVLVRFHFSLTHNGFLVLGQADNLSAHSQSSLFTPVSRDARVFTKVPDAHRDARLLSIAFC
ncbi:MAG: protein-glutamate O-methyltransferase CheR [Calothrix sp. FI2-JRJ7]|jgi:two-component system CheB/CheR fusion protein|nr:protein-glutamate O-methyltransferase CheR [Calothrix sp. FI2-JRJ7]